MMDPRNLNVSTAATVLFMILYEFQSVPHKKLNSEEHGAQVIILLYFYSAFLSFAITIILLFEEEPLRCSEHLILCFTDKLN